MIVVLLVRVILRAAVIAALVIAIAALSGCTYQSRERLVRAGLGLTTAAIACDVGETMWLGHEGAWDRTYMRGLEVRHLKETNPLLGETPSTAALVLALAGATAINAGAHLGRLPQWLRLAWSAAILGAETYAVAHNARWSPACGLGQ